MSIVTKRIFLIRHGETDHNKQKIIQGREIDSPLNEQGREQATKTGRYLKLHHSDDKNVKSQIICSSQLRAIQTAEIINQYLETNLVLNDLLVEFKKGKLSGVCESDPNMIHVHEAEKRYRDIHKDPIKRNLQGIEAESRFLESELRHLDLGIESYHESIQKVRSVVQELITSSCSTIYVVSHSGFLDILLKEMFKTNVTFNGDKSNGKNCWICLVEYNSIRRTDWSGHFRLITAPNTEHLGLDLDQMSHNITPL